MKRDVVIFRSTVQVLLIQICIYGRVYDYAIKNNFEYCNAVRVFTSVLLITLLLIGIYVTLFTGRNTFFGKRDLLYLH